MIQDIKEKLKELTNAELQEIQNEVVRLKMCNHSIEFLG